MKIIEVKQKPIIAYSLLERISNEVIEKINSLAIDKIEANETTLKTIKNTRAELGKEFKTLEEQRKMVKEIVLKDYNEFEDTYKRLIATHFKQADITLKNLVASVDDKILSKKINRVKEFFEDKNKNKFLEFEDLNIKIIKSRSDKSIKEEIIQYLSQVDHDLKTIETLEESDRVLAKYQISKNLAEAIAQTNLEIDREKKIQAQKAKKEEEEAKNTDKRVFDSIVIEAIPPKEEKKYKTSFKVRGTKQQLSELKNFIIAKEIEIL